MRFAWAKLNLHSLHERRTIWEPILKKYFRAVKDMIALVDEDRDGKISFREFLMIFRKQSEGEIQSDSGLDKLVKLTEIDVSATVIFRF